MQKFNFGELSTRQLRKFISKMGSEYKFNWEIKIYVFHKLSVIMLPLLDQRYQMFFIYKYFTYFQILGRSVALHRHKPCLHHVVHVLPFVQCLRTLRCYAHILSSSMTDFLAFNWT